MEYSDICRFIQIPQLKQAVKRPFGATDAGFLILQGVLHGESLWGDCWPVITPV